ncbi:lipase family protein [Microbulbifer salipaludis]|uniref:Lipase family protein n=1 Tax=Microbulbifer salipaludis TaxID=187980 RepID=A0ABS3E403_9GAMM|nr:lipase family protein [Microbulbifer salipaludis]MBN8429839.1 lipase family protein [Microbulbifer salipaludis]
MNNLTPEFAARLASDIYDIKLSLRQERFKKLYENYFNIEETKLKGKTGAFTFLKSTHTMGIATHGINDYTGHSFVALKGTASLYDGLTDLNAGLKKFHTGGLVHQGFYYTFESFVKSIDDFVDDLPNDVHTIHCVGHSLGGALATLAADYLKLKSNKTVKLYTFGSPRVGLDFFANGATKRLEDSNIFRVYHRTDPVAMVPTWPFIHVPDSGPGDLLLQSGVALNPAQYHKMDNYIASLSGGEEKHNWDLVRKKRPPTLIQRSIQSWLESDGPLSLTLNTAWVAAEAVMWVLKKVVELAGIALVVTGATTFTLMDQLAIFLKKAHDFGKKVSHWVTRLLIRLGRMIGIVVADGTNITIALIRTIFIRMHNAVSELVLRAGRHTEH